MNATRRQAILAMALVSLGTTVGARAETPAVALKQYRVLADGHPLTVWMKRPAKPRGAILLIHGRTWSARPNFDLHVGRRSVSVMDAFVKEGYAAYALDMRGYGSTPQDASGWITPTRAAKDVGATLTWLHEREKRLPKPVLVGYSRGSVVSLLTAQLYPDTISALVLYGIGFDVGAKPKPVVEPPQPPRQPTTGSAAAADFITPEAVSPDVVQAYVRQALKTDPIRVDWRREEEFGAINAALVPVPTLLLHGARDPYVKIDAHFRLFSALGTETKAWVVLPNADHAAHVEQAQQPWVRAILDFVELPRSKADIRPGSGGQDQYGARR